MRLFNRLTSRLSRTSSNLQQGMKLLFTGEKLDEAALDELHDYLLMADFGTTVSQDLIDKLKSKRLESASLAQGQQVLANAITEILEPRTAPLPPALKGQLAVMMIVGVNGSGKTTSIAKLLNYYNQQGLKCGVVAGDTFRAAANAQLATWAQRLSARFYEGAEKADPAALAYDSIIAARQDGLDVLLIDTAGRLHSQDNLMAELAKVRRVIGKLDEAYPHAALMILDGTVGQTALTQVEEFNKATPLTGILVSKLDGTAKAGVVVALAQQYKIPLVGMGLGEQPDDLSPFEPEVFAGALLGLDENAVAA